MKGLVRTTLSASLSLLLAGALLGCGGGDKSGATTPAATEAPGDAPAEPAPAEPAEPSAAAGADLAPQLAQGEQVHADACSVCHGDQGEGKGKKNPAVIGGGTLHEFKTGADLLTYLEEKMPKDDPGSLSEADYLAVTAWLLQKNGKLSGQALTPESAASISIQ